MNILDLIKIIRSNVQKFTRFGHTTGIMIFYGSSEFHVNPTSFEASISLIHICHIICIMFITKTIALGNSMNFGEQLNFPGHVKGTIRKVI